ncbi:MAG: hypothetical protein IPM95_00135 [Sphingobacteriales bacterium]|nr:hypothetical protein [Sphingobacteriales bacterium]
MSDIIYEDHFPEFITGARAGVIDVVNGGTDPTGGATFWDGTDFLAWGLNSPNGTPHNKFEEFSSIKIDLYHYISFAYKQLEKYLKAEQNTMGHFIQFLQMCLMM